MFTVDVKQQGNNKILEISLFRNKCTAQGIRESQIAQNNQRNRMLHAMYIWILRNLSSWGMHQLEIFHQKNHIFSKKMYRTVQGIRESHIAQNNEINRTLHALYIWIENLSYNEESFKLGHAPT